MKGEWGVNIKIQNTFLLLLTLTLTIFINKIQTQTEACCCDQYLLVAPISVQEECLYQHDHFTSQWKEDYTGYASALDACAFNGVGQTCFGCNCVTPSSWSDEYTIGKSSDSYTPGCGNTVEISRSFCLNCGLGSRCVFQQIEVVDTIEPELLVPADATVECVSTDGIAGPEYNVNHLSNYFGSARATDLCTNPTLTEQTQTTGNSCTLSIERTFTADDGCLTSEDSQFVYFVDTSPPLLLSPSVQSFTCDQTNLISAGNNNNIPSVIDSCDNWSGTTPTAVDVRYDGRCTGDYSIERTWSVLDKCNNKGTFIQVIVVTDVDPPSVTTSGGVAAGVNTFTEVICTVPPPNVYSVTDSCGGDVFNSYEESVSGLDDFSNYFDLIRTYSAADDCGNSIRWEEVYRVDIGSNVVFTGPASEISSTKGSNILLNFNLMGTLCKEGGFVVFDLGAAEFISSTLIDCTAGSGGPLYCPINPSSTLNLSFNIVIFVDSNYAPATLQIRYSFIESDPTSNIIDEDSIILLQFA